MRTRPLSIRLHNDYELVIQGLRAMLAPYSDRVQVVETDVDGKPSRSADVTLYDTFASARNGPGSLEEVLRAPGSGRVVVYAWNSDTDLVAETLRRGCRGYVHKSLSARRLVECLEDVGAGMLITVVDENARTGDFAPKEASWPGRSEGLTVREAEVVAWITQGLSNQEIAARCYVSLNSLKSYIRSAYRKMGVQRRAQAVRWGMEHGMAPR